MSLTPRFISPVNLAGDYDVDEEFSQGQLDRNRGDYDPPSRDPYTAIVDGIIGNNEPFDAAQRAYEAGFNKED